MTDVLKWEGDVPPDKEALEARVRQEIADLRESGLGDPANLFFHAIQLTDDFSGPGVTLFGREGCDAFFCEYHATIEWASIVRDEDDAVAAALSQQAPGDGA